MSAYWENLSREAVLHGAGVIELFLREGEALKQNKELIKQMEKQERVSIVDNVLNKNIAFSPANAIQKISKQIESGAVFAKDKVIVIYKKTYNSFNKLVSGFLLQEVNFTKVELAEIESMQMSINDNDNEDEDEDKEYEKNLQLKLSRFNLDNNDEDEIYERNLEIESIKAKLKELENQVKILVDSRFNNEHNNKNEIENKKEDLKIIDKELNSKEKEEEDNDIFIDKDVGGAKEYISYNQGDVIVSEIDWKGSIENASYEWIELYGNSANIVNLAGWTIEKQDSNGILSFLIGDTGDNFNNTNIISPGSYFLLERNEFATSIVSDKIYDGSLRNLGEHLF